MAMIEEVGRAASQLATRNPHVAIVDDDQIYRGYLALMFRGANCRVTEAASGGELRAVLAADEIDCIVLDYKLASENGLSVHAELRQMMRDPPPIVIISAERNERIIIKAFRAGVTDYVLKDGLKPDEIFRSVVGAIARRSEAKARDAEFERLRRNAEFDDATGLYCRKSIDARLAAVAQRGGDGRCAVVLLRPDNIDDIGRKFGLVVADKARRVFLTRLKDATGPHSLAGRYDDARLIVISDVEVRRKAVDAACRRFAEAVNADVNLEAAAFRIGASIGAAVWPLDGAGIADVLAAAERALDESRTRGVPWVLAGGASDDAATEPEEPSLATMRSSNRRVDIRHRVLKRGHIVLPNLCSVIDCVIRDLSVGGARLRVDGHFIAPDEFHLVNLSTNQKRHVSRRWQHGSEFGVMFLD